MVLANVVFLWQTLEIYSCPLKVKEQRRKCYLLINNYDQLIKICDKHCTDFFFNTENHNSNVSGKAKFNALNT